MSPHLTSIRRTLLRDPHHVHLNKNKFLQLALQFQFTLLWMSAAVLLLRCFSSVCEFISRAPKTLKMQQHRDCVHVINMKRLTAQFAFFRYFFCCNFLSFFVVVECRCKIIIYMDLVQKWNDKQGKRKVMDTLHVHGIDSNRFLSNYFLQCWSKLDLIRMKKREKTSSKRRSPHSHENAHKSSSRLLFRSLFTFFLIPHITLEKY